MRDHENRIEAAHSSFERCRRSHRLRSHRSCCRTHKSRGATRISTLFYPASPNGNYASPYAQPQYQQPQYQQPQYGYGSRSTSSRSINNRNISSRSTLLNSSHTRSSLTRRSPYHQPITQPATPAQALSADQLEQLLAPIALYPDALLAQILTASTYPAQVAVADQWLQQMRAQGYGAPDQIAAGADEQADWDPSVKALTAFPDVLDMLNHNLDWTTALGNAYYNQPQDVMQTVQVLRDRAQQAGNLQTTPQEDVTDNQGYIDIAPPNPEVVYVPTYDPWDVYGAPIAPIPASRSSARSVRSSAACRFNMD